MNYQAEKLKVKFGSALAEEVLENKIITIPGLKGRSPKEISEKNLALIIQARMEEILEYVMYEIGRSGYKDKLIGGIVLTGGGSRLKHLEDLVEFHTGIPTKVSYPIEHLAHGYIKDLSSPVFSTSIGLLLNGLETRKYTTAIEVEPEPEPESVTVQTTPEMARQGSKRSMDDFDAHDTDDEMDDSEDQDRSGGAGGSRKSSFWGNVFNRTKDWFEASPDSDLN